MRGAWLVLLFLICGVLYSKTQESDADVSGDEVDDENLKDLENSITSAAEDDVDSDVAELDRQGSGVGKANIRSNDYNVHVEVNVDQKNKKERQKQIKDAKDLEKLKNKDRSMMGNLKKPVHVEFTKPQSENETVAAANLLEKIVSKLKTHGQTKNVTSDFDIAVNETLAEAKPEIKSDTKSDKISDTNSNTKSESVKIEQSANTDGDGKSFDIMELNKPVKDHVGEMLTKSESVSNADISNNEINKASTEKQVENSTVEEFKIEMPAKKLQKSFRIVIKEPSKDNSDNKTNIMAFTNTENDGRITDQINGMNTDSMKVSSEEDDSSSSSGSDESQDGGADEESLEDDDTGSDDSDDGSVIQNVNGGNANVNRNIASTLSGKALTVVFQENTGNLGNEAESYVHEKSESSTRDASDKKISSNLVDIHRGQPIPKLFNDSLFEQAANMAKIKLDDEKSRATDSQSETSDENHENEEGEEGEEEEEEEEKSIIPVISKEEDGIKRNFIQPLKPGTLPQNTNHRRNELILGEHSSNGFAESINRNNWLTEYWTNDPHVKDEYATLLFKKGQVIPKPPDIRSIPSITLPDLTRSYKKSNITHRGNLGERKLNCDTSKMKKINKERKLKQIGKTKSESRKINRLNVTEEQTKTMLGNRKLSIPIDDPYDQNGVEELYKQGRLSTLQSTPLYGGLGDSWSPNEASSMNELLGTTKDETWVDPFSVESKPFEGIEPKALKDLRDIQHKLQDSPNAELEAVESINAYAKDGTTDSMFDENPEKEAIKALNGNVPEAEHIGLPKSEDNPNLSEFLNKMQEQKLANGNFQEQDSFNDHLGYSDSTNQNIVQQGQTNQNSRLSDLSTQNMFQIPSSGHDGNPQNPPSAESLPSVESSPGAESPPSAEIPQSSDGMIQGSEKLLKEEKKADEQSFKEKEVQAEQKLLEMEEERSQNELKYRNQGPQVASQTRVHIPNTTKPNSTAVSRHSVPKRMYGNPAKNKTLQKRRKKKEKRKYNRKSNRKERKKLVKRK